MPSHLQIEVLGFPRQTIDPFLFCVHHDDAHPCGIAQLGPDTPRAGRNLGHYVAGMDGIDDPARHPGRIRGRRSLNRISPSGHCK